MLYNLKVFMNVFLGNIHLNIKILSIFDNEHSLSLHSRPCSFIDWFAVWLLIYYLLIPAYYRTAARSLNVGQP